MAWNTLVGENKPTQVTTGTVGMGNHVHTSSMAHIAAQRKAVANALQQVAAKSAAPRFQDSGIATIQKGLNANGVPAHAAHVSQAIDLMAQHGGLDLPTANALKAGLPVANPAVLHRVAATTATMMGHGAVINPSAMPGAGPRIGVAPLPGGIQPMQP